MKHTREAVREALAGPQMRIFPSLLNCDFGCLAEEIECASRCGAVAVHWDVMDGDFVPNFTYGPPLIASLRPQSPVIFDAHLMMRNPERYLDDFVNAGCDIITVHLEAVPQPGELIRRIKEADCLAGLTINPSTEVESLGPWLDQVDLVLVMSVNPGFGGQKFDPNALDKLRWVREHGPDSLLIQVDGGINQETIGNAVQAGAKLCVVGSGFYGASDRQGAFDSLTSLAQ